MTTYDTPRGHVDAFVRVFSQIVIGIFIAWMVVLTAHCTSQDDCRKTCREAGGASLELSTQCVCTDKDSQVWRP